MTATAAVTPSDARDHPVFACHELSVTLGEGVQRRRVLDRITLTVERGEFISVVGTSGVGKTTLLRVLGGLELPSGSVRVKYLGEDVVAPPRGVVMVFQDYSASLLPWRTVIRNVALGIEGRTNGAERRRLVDEALEMVGLQDRGGNYPFQLSGGMQQRVQLARALVMQPAALIMDEPFGALDAMTKASLQDALREIHLRTGMTIVFITHDIEEAVYLGTRVIVLAGQPGRVVGDFAVDLPEQRDQIATREDARYLRLRHRIHESIRVD